MNDNLDSLLDITLDDLKDLPEFAVYPAGAHRVTSVLEAKKIGEHPAVEVKFTLIETVELADPTQTMPVAGTESSVAFMMDNEFGQGNFKKFIAPLAAHFGTTNVRTIAEQLAGTELLIVTKQRQNKEKTATYLDVVSVQVM